MMQIVVTLNNSSVPNLKMSSNSCLDMLVFLDAPMPGRTTKCVNIIFFLATWVIRSSTELRVTNLKTREGGGGKKGESGTRPIKWLSWGNRQLVWQTPTLGSLNVPIAISYRVGHNANSYIYSLTSGTISLTMPKLIHIQQGPILHHQWRTRIESQFDNHPWNTRKRVLNTWRDEKRLNTKAHDHQKVCIGIYR